MVLWRHCRTTPRFFIIPEGKHCDLDSPSLIKPGEEVVLLTWSQRERVEDSCGCVESVPVKAGRYTFAGNFFESTGPSDRNADSYEKADVTGLEWRSTIRP